MRALASLANRPKVPGDTPASLAALAVSEYQKYVKAQTSLGITVSETDAIQSMAFESLMSSFSGQDTENNPAYGITLAVDQNQNLHGRAAHALYKLQSIVNHSGSRDKEFVKAPAKKKPKNKKPKQPPKQQGE